MKVQQFTDFVSIEEMKREPSQMRSTRAESKIKLLSDLTIDSIV